MEYEQALNEKQSQNQFSERDMQDFKTLMKDNENLKTKIEKF